MLKCSSSGIELAEGAGEVCANEVAQSMDTTAKTVQRRMDLPSRARWPVHRRVKGEIVSQKDWSFVSVLLNAGVHTISRISHGSLQVAACRRAYFPYERRPTPRDDL